MQNATDQQLYAAMQNYQQQIESLKAQLNMVGNNPAAVAQVKNNITQAVSYFQAVKNELERRQQMNTGMVNMGVMNNNMMANNVSNMGISTMTNTNNLFNNTATSFGAESTLGTNTRYGSNEEIIDPNTVSNTNNNAAQQTTTTVTNITNVTTNVDPEKFKPGSKFVPLTQSGIIANTEIASDGRFKYVYIQDENNKEKDMRPVALGKLDGFEVIRHTSDNSRFRIKGLEAGMNNFYVEGAVIEDLVVEKNIDNDIYFKLLDKAFKSAEDDSPLINLGKYIMQEFTNDDDRMEIEGSVCDIDDMLTDRLNNLINLTAEVSLKIDSFAEDIKELMTVHIFTIEDLAKKTILMKALSTLEKTLKRDMDHLRNNKYEGQFVTEHYKTIPYLELLPMVFFSSFRVTHDIYRQVTANNKMIINKDSFPLLFDALEEVYENTSMKITKKAMLLLHKVPNVSASYMISKNVFGYVIVKHD